MSQPDQHPVPAGFLEWLRAVHADDTATIAAWERPEAGFSSETLLVDVQRSDAVERLVLKLPPSGPAIFPSCDFGLQARLQQAVADAGIPAPVPATFVDDLRWIGRPFLVMPRLDGHIVAEVPLRDRWLTKVDQALSETVHGTYLDTVADINRIDWRSHGLHDTVPVRDNAAELDHWRAYLDWYADGEVLVPALVEALDWCAAHQPAAEPEPSLLWGDVRLGNVIFDEERALVAVLDWEMATIGAAEHDLAWALTLESIQAELFQRTVPGFLHHDAAVARYQARLGRPVQDLEWYEILAVVRSTAVMTRIAHLRAQAGEPELFPIADNPILGILQRRITDAGVIST